MSVMDTVSEPAERERERQIRSVEGRERRVCGMLGREEESEQRTAAWSTGGKQ